MNTNTTAPAGVVSSTELGVLPEPVGFRSRYRSEPGMIGHYPWTYADHRKRKYDRPECEYEDLFTAEQVRAAVAAERKRWAKVDSALRTAIHTLERDGDEWGVCEHLRAALRPNTEVDRASGSGRTQS